MARSVRNWVTSARRAVSSSLSDMDAPSYDVMPEDNGEGRPESVASAGARSVRGLGPARSDLRLPAVSAITWETQVYRPAVPVSETDDRLTSRQAVQRSNAMTVQLTPPILETIKVIDV